MVLAGCLINEEREAELRNLGVKDSKMLTPRRRRFLARQIKKISKYHIVLVHPSEIDGRNHVGLNLNKIEAIKSADIINKFNKLNKGKQKQQIKVIIDCPSTNIQAWKNYLMRFIDNKENLQILCEHKADVNHPVVSAASIIAKVTRDFEIEKIKKQLGVEFGSGYPSDPETKKFLQEYYKQHKKNGIFRETWGTIKNHKAKKEQRKLADF